MFFKQIFEEKLAQYSYLIGCQQTREAIIVDPMRDIDRYDRIAENESLRIVAAADTHIHADYLTGLREYAERGVKVFASDEGDEDWKYEWLLESDYDYELLKDGDQFSIGNIHLRVWHTPGHTPEHISYTVTDNVAADAPMGLLSGDFIFVGDVGRPDLLESAAGQKGVMESSARTLYKSVKEFKKLPEYLQLWPGHGAGSACGKALGAVPESTVGYELRFNPSIHAAESEKRFVDYILEGQPEPPLYFARMKRDNRSGPKILGDLPRPKRMDVEVILEKVKSNKSVILDTRSRSAFMGGHIPGSLLSSFNKQFNTVAGSYITEDQEIYLIIEETNLEEAVRDLVRIGLDYIPGFITPADLMEYHDRGGGLGHIETIDFNKTAELLDIKDYLVLDVRKRSEFVEGHLPSAVNIAHTRLLEQMEKLTKDNKVMVHCLSGARASVASALLKKEGFDVAYIDDHIKNWPNLVVD